MNVQNYLNFDGRAEEAIEFYKKALGATVEAIMRFDQSPEPCPGSMPAGSEKKVTVKPEDAYGQVNPQAFQEVPKDKLPPEALKVGTVLTARGPEGQSVPVRVHEIKENTVVMDFNHPLAGKTLVFDVKVTEVKPANP